jgi:8-oxo-dGTP pyrophosphatase MutT (NUDIX family)
MHNYSIAELIADEQRMKEHIRMVLGSRKRRIIPREDLKEAGVLVPLAWNGGDPIITVTKRSMSVEHHKGEISFPGGRVESGDKGLVGTALREAQEEIGLDPKDVEVLGLLDDHISILGYHITPVVGMVPHPYRFTINKESETILQVPLRHALGESAWMAERSFFRGKGINVYFLEIDGGIVWGATARILKHFVDIITGTRVPFSMVTAEVKAWIADLLASQVRYMNDRE